MPGAIANSRTIASPSFFKCGLDLCPRAMHYRLLSCLPTQSPKSFFMWRLKGVLHLAFLGLISSRWRSLVAVLTVAVAFLLYSFLIALRASFETHVVNIRGAGDLLTVNAISPARTLPLAYVWKIKTIPGIKENSIYYGTTFVGYYQRHNADNFISIQAISDNFGVPQPGVRFSANSLRRWSTDKAGALVGSELARKLSWNVGDTIPIMDSVQKNNASTTWVFHVDGIYSAPAVPYMDSTMYVHFSYLNDSRLTDKDTVAWITEATSDPTSASRIADEIDRLFANADPPTLTTAPVAATSTLHNFGDVGRIAMYISIAAFFGMLLVTVNIASQAVYERRLDYAILKTIGFRTPFLMLLVLSESFIVMVVGALFGLGLGFALVSALRPHLIELLPKFSFSQISIVITIVSVMILWVLTALDPCFQMLRIRTINRMQF